MTSDVGTLSVRLALPSDGPALRVAVVELHEEERRLHDSRLPGEATADAYLVWMLTEAVRDGAVFVAEASGVFAGFAAGWVVQENVIEETPDSNRFGYISDVCVLPPFRGRRMAALLSARRCRCGHWDASCEERPSTPGRPVGQTQPGSWGESERRCPMTLSDRCRWASARR
jgi:hypothetical protein